MANYGKILTTPEEIIAHAKDPYKKARALGYRSGLEVSVAEQLKKMGVPVQYEPFAFRYKPQREYRLYTPDYILPNGIVVETKGLFASADRTKHRDLKAMYPDLDVRFVFSNPNQRLSKASRTTYGAWCANYEFQYATRLVPLVWVQEPSCPKRWAAISEAKSPK